MAQKLNIDIVAKDKSKQALTGVRGGLDRLKKSVFNLQNAFIGLGTGLAIRSLVNTGKQIEGLQVRLKFLFGTAQEGAKAFDEMAKFAARVPFSLEEIQAGSGVLAVVSKDAKELANLMEITGNVAAVTGLDFKTTAEQIQRSMSAGISAADLFRDRGVKSMLGFKAGAVVTVEETAEAFQKIFGKGGKFGDATKALAETFEGTLSMIGDKFFNFKRTILEAGFFEGLKKEFGQLNKFLEENAKSIDDLATDIGISLAFAVVKVKDAIVLLKDNMDKIIVLFKLLIAIKVVKLFLALGGAIQFAAKQMLKFSLASIMTVKGLKGLLTLIAKGGAVYIAFKGIDKLFEETAKSFDDFSDGVKNVLPPARDLHKTMVQVKDVVSEIDTFLYNYENELGIKIPSATEKAIQKFRELNDTALENMKNKFKDIRTTIAEGLNAGITSFSNALSRAIILGEDLGKSFKKMVADALVNTLALLIEVVIRMGIQKILGDKLLLGENKRLNSAKKYTSELQKQVALAAILAVLTGGGSMAGGGGSSFMGRASGGSVQKDKPYMVGENGAELFIPNSSGQIQQSARGGGNSGAVNVNFTINAVNAAGIDQLLIERRGTISRIINESVNERGRGAII